jgi:hypothetical protein
MRAMMPAGIKMRAMMPAGIKMRAMMPAGIKMRAMMIAMMPDGIKTPVTSSGTSQSVRNGQIPDLQRGHQRHNVRSLHKQRHLPGPTPEPGRYARKH